MTGRDDKLQSVLVLAQDGWTAPLRILTANAASQIQDKPLLQLPPLMLVVGTRLLLLPLIHLNLKSQILSSDTTEKARQTRSALRRSQGKKRADKKSAATGANGGGRGNGGWGGGCSGGCCWVV